MRFVRTVIPAILALSLLSACGGSGGETPTETATQVPDPCNKANLPVEVEKTHKHMREFDDYSALASNTPQAQLVQVIPDLQRVLREAEDETVPACLINLKTLQIKHMQTVVQTLLAFMGNSDVSLVNAGIARARELRAQYDVEMARLLGVTLTVITATPAGSTEIAPTPAAQSTPPATSASMATNTGANELNLRAAPDFNSAPLAVLGVGQSAAALGRAEDSQWILVQVPDRPDQTAWVYASVVQLSVPVESLPVAPP